MITGGRTCASTLPSAFVGHPQAVIEAALAAARSAYNLIDMTRHTGEHPRIGAMVSAFVTAITIESEEDSVDSPNEHGMYSRLGCGSVRTRSERYDGGLY